MEDPKHVATGYAEFDNEGKPARWANLAKKSWCGRSLAGQWAYIDAGHMTRTLRNGGGPYVCKDCLRVIRALIDTEMDE